MKMPPFHPILARTTGSRGAIDIPREAVPFRIVDGRTVLAHTRLDANDRRLHFWRRIEVVLGDFEDVRDFREELNGQDTTNLDAEIDIPDLSVDTKPAVERVTLAGTA